MNAAAPIEVTQQLQSLAINAIAPSTTHIQKMRRSRFDKVLLQELADSIKGTKGVLQPIVVRPHPKPTDLLKHEIVAGERRWVASGMAAFDTILAVVRELDDEQVLEIQLVENLQREGLHEMEEAEGYQELMKLKKLSADQVADKIGKSRRYVFNRLKLLDLCPDARKAFYEGRINASVALFLARITHRETQREALGEMMEISHREGGDPVTARQALELIHEKYMLALKDAPFDTKVIYFRDNGQQIGIACGECPKRTGNQKDLFSDVKSADVCTDVKCFGEKRDAANAIRIAQAKETGQKVITGKPAKEIFPYEHSDHVYNNDFTTVDQRPSEFGYEKTWKQLLGKNLPTPTLVQHPSSGRLVEVYAKADLKQAAKAAGLKAERSIHRSTDNKAAELRNRIETAARVRILAAIRTANRGRSTFGLEDLRMVALSLWEGLRFDTQKHLVDVLNADAGKPKPPKAKGHLANDYVHDYANTIAKLPAEELSVLLFDLMLISDCHPHGDGGALDQTAQRLRIDADKIRKEVKAEIDEREQAKRAVKKASKK